MIHVTSSYVMVYKQTNTHPDKWCWTMIKHDTLWWSINVNKWKMINDHTYDDNTGLCPINDDKWWMIIHDDKWWMEINDYTLNMIIHDHTSWTNLKSMIFSKGRNQSYEQTSLIQFVSSHS